MNYQDVIQTGLNYIAMHQLPDGGFVSLSSVSPSDFSVADSRRTVFLPALMRLALQQVDGGDDIRARLTQYLEEQRNQDWSFNYWDTHAGPELPVYPNDLDDTSTALAGLSLSQPGIFDGKAWAAITTLLVASETATGGPYRTWLVSDDAPAHWLDTDVIVNSNIAYFLSLHSIELPALTGYIEDTISQGRLTSQYYPNEIATIYSLSRWYRGSSSAALRYRSIGCLQQFGPADDLYIAQAVTSLLRCGANAETVDDYIKHLAGRQRSDGSWPAQAYCLDPAVDDRQYYAGAATYTTACCIEAIQLYLTCRQVATVQRKPLPTIIGQKHIARHIRTITSPGLRQDVRRLHKRITRLETSHHISTMPGIIAHNLGYDVEPAIRRQLAECNTWGWMAYSGFDDGLDTPDVSLLPAACWCLRQLADSLTQTLPGTAFQIEWRRILQLQDSANAWEIVHTRNLVRSGVLQLDTVPDYDDLWQLAQRSWGYVIPTAGILLAAGKTMDGMEYRQMLAFWRHYLIARQLNDDAHDWWDDLCAGSVNAVAAQLLRTDPRTDRWLQNGMRLARNQRRLQTRFWQETVLWWAATMREHIDLARQSVEALRTDPVELHQWLDGLESTVEDTLRQRQQTRDFIQAF